MIVKFNKSKFSDIYYHLKCCDEYFTPYLSTYVDLNSYSKKLESNADRFEYWNNQTLIGLLALYKRVDSNSVFITNMSLIHNFFGKGYANNLINRAVSFYKNEGFSRIDLEVNINNIRAIKFYSKNMFNINSSEGKNIFMKRNLK
tara:strand:- start:130 stop:564 length:435 start_codon:yes stop_codon:yes gene_type:complete